MSGYKLFVGKDISPGGYICSFHHANNTIVPDFPGVIQYVCKAPTIALENKPDYISLNLDEERSIEALRKSLVKRDHMIGQSLDPMPKRKRSFRSSLSDPPSYKRP